MKKGLALRFKKNAQGRVRVVCKEKCSWMLYARKGQDEVFKVKSYKPKHKCCKKNTSKMVTCDFLANHFKSRITSQPNIT